MRFLIRSAIKDLRWRRRDPAALAIWIGIPLFLATLFGLLAGGSGPTPRAHVLLVDEDRTLLSQLLARAGGGGTTQQVLEIEAVSTRAEGRARLDAGKATALLVIPKGFADAVLREQPATLTLVTNPSQRILPSVVEEGLEILLEAVFYAQRVLGGPMRRIAVRPPGGGFPSNDAVATLSTEINDTLRRLQPVVSPPVLDLKFEQAGARQSDDLGFATFFFPGILLMSLLFVSQGMSSDTWAEKEQGVLRRAMSTPQPPGLLLGARLLAAAVVFAAVILVGLLVGVILYGISPLRIPLALAWTVYVGCALLVFFTLIQLAGSTRRGASLLTLMLVFPLMMLGGSMFPMQAMPGWMGSIGRMTPNGQAVVQLEAILYRSPDARGLALAALAIGLPAVVAFLVCARRLRAFAVK
jgi:ABC-2 type transport system permease protein